MYGDPKRNPPIITLSSSWRLSHLARLISALSVSLGEKDRYRVRE